MKNTCIQLVHNTIVCYRKDSMSICSRTLFHGDFPGNKSKELLWEMNYLSVASLFFR